MIFIFIFTPEGQYEIYKGDTEMTPLDSHFPSVTPWNKFPIKKEALCNWAVLCHI